MLLLICILGLILRYINTTNNNVLFGYDQYEDLFHTRKIILGDPPLIGRPIYGDPNLHHGVLYFYYNLIPYVFSNANPFAVISWNNIFNVGASIAAFSISRLLFKDKLLALISAFLVAVSYEYIQFSGWISSTAPTLFSVPLYFLGLAAYYRQKSWGLPVAALGLGMSIQLEIFFVYLIPIFAIFFFLFKPAFPTIKTFLVSCLILLIFASTFILTELKLRFAGIISLLHFSETFDDGQIGYLDRVGLYLDKFVLTLANNLFPTHPEFGWILVVIIGVASVFFLLNPRMDKSEKKGLVFLIIFVLSPVLMLALGFHKQPWFLVGIPAGVALLTAFILSQLKYKLLTFLIVLAIGYSNITALIKNHGIGPPLFKAETSSLLSSQLSVVDYTYNESAGEPFSINSVTYPLYHNALWEYHYSWYGQRKFNYKPDWLGGEQPEMYRSLHRINKGGNHSFMIIDNTYRIPEGQKSKGKEWAKEQGKIVDEKIINGFTVLKVEISSTTIK